jgi:hypothetical protein
LRGVFCQILSPLDGETTIMNTLTISEIEHDTAAPRTSQPAAERFHSLDALRAFVLLLGVVFHSLMAYVLPPGIWAVGTTQPATTLWWFICYAHCFRMEVFFLLAGFFTCLVIEKRGVASFLRDRAKRILLVFVVALYPIGRERIGSRKVKQLPCAGTETCRCPVS